MPEFRGVRRGILALGCLLSPALLRSTLRMRARGWHNLCKFRSTHGVLTPRMIPTPGEIMRPNGNLMTQSAFAKFKSKGRKHPPDWEQPTGDAGQMLNRGLGKESNGSPNFSRIMVPPTDIKLHCSAANNISEIIENYVKGICGAIADAWGMWMTSAAIGPVMFTGPVGTLTPGSVKGPPLQGLIMSCGAPMSKPAEAKFSKSISAAVSSAWQAYSMGLAGTLDYPPLACFPSPAIVAIPNIPKPVAAFASPGEAMLSPAALSGAMMAQHADPTAAYAQDIFDSVAESVNNMLQTWKASTMINNVLANGAVPSWTPVSPAGPGVGVANGAACFV